MITHNKANLFSSLPSLSVMDRYILQEIIGPFLFGIGLFTTLGVSVGVLFDLVRKITESGLLIDIALRVLMLKTPEFIVLAFPMSMLLATLMGYSRFSSDSELIALRSIGLSVYRLIIPAIILSLLVTGITFWFNNFIAPVANYQASLTMATALTKQRSYLKETNIIYPEYKKIELEDGTRENKLMRLFYAKEFDGKQMKGLRIIDNSQEGVDQIITAQAATWNILENVWDFYNGTIYVIAADGSYRNIIRFEHQKMAISGAPFDLAQRQRSPDEMSIFEAQDYLQILQLGGDEKKIRKLKVRIQEKVSLPFVCLVFAVIGSALGLRPRNNSRATSFGICVFLIFGQYLFSFITSSLGISGALPPVVSAWLPVFTGLSAGIIILVKAAQ